MNFLEWLYQAPTLVDAFTLKIALVVFFISLIGEAFVISIPILFEYIFISAGINVRLGVLPVWDMLLLALTSQLGRQAGALIMYFLSNKSTTFIGRLIKRRFPIMKPISDSPLRFLRHLDRLSPLGVAAGRLLWLRVPITLVLGARRQLKTLILGIAISSTVYEAIYIGLGAIGGQVFGNKMGPQMIIWFGVSMAIVYAAALIIRFVINKKKNKMIKKNNQCDANTKQDG
jgi:membrane-associated protein